MVGLEVVGGVVGLEVGGGNDCGTYGRSVGVVGGEVVGGVVGGEVVGGVVQVM